MRKSFKIGQKEYKFKKNAIAHYRTILNSYDFGQSLNDSDYNDLRNLLDYDYFNYLDEIDSEPGSYREEIENQSGIDENGKIDEDELLIEDIKIAKVQFNTRCFEIFYNNKTSQYISYLMIINNTKYTPDKLFYIACRNSVYNDIRSVKQTFFTKTQLKDK